MNDWSRQQTAEGYPARVKDQGHRALRILPPPCQEVVIPKPGEDPWAWEGDRGFVLTGAGPFVLVRAPACSYARPARPEDFHATFGETGAAFVSSSSSPVALRLAVLIPTLFLSQAWGFLRTAWRRYRTEDILLLYFYPAERRYELIHPTLECADQLGVGYELPPTPGGALHFGSFHSHPGTAHHSSTDDADVRGTPGIHVVLGDLSQHLPSLTCVLSTGRECLEVDPTDLFDNLGQFTPADFPPEWLERSPDLPGYLSRRGRLERKEVHHGNA